MSDHTIDPDLYAVDLASGGHETRDQGMCLMEWIAYLAHEQHSDHPECVSPVLGSMGRGLNDVLPHARRQELKTIGVAALGTAGDGFDEARSFMALDWLIRTYLPAWLDLSPRCRESAQRVRELGRIVDLVSAERAGPVVRAAQKGAAAARDATRDAAWVAAGDAARDAAGDAAVAAAGDAARVAARDAAGAAARVAARVAARDAAGDAARDAAGAAAGDAAVAAARAAVQPTVDELQESAISLFAGMVKGPFPEARR